MKGRKLKRYDDGGLPRIDPYNPQLITSSELRQPGQTIQPYNPYAHGAPIKQKTVFDQIGKFIKDNPAETMNLGLGFLGNSLEANAAAQNDRKNAIINGGSDSMYSTNTGSRGDWSSNEGYFRPNQAVVTQFGANPYNPYGIPRAALGMDMSQTTSANLSAGLLPSMTQMAVPQFTMPQNFVPQNVVTQPIENINIPKNNISSNTSSPDFKSFIAAKESGGDYGALPKRKDGTLVSSAVGKYQFLWNKNKDWITKVTGVDTKEGFRKDPEAQEKAFNYWDQFTLTPAALKIQQELGVKAPLDAIKSKVHFAGAKGAYDFYETGKQTKDGFGTTTATYAEGGEYEMDNTELQQFLKNGGQVEYLQL